MSLTNIEPNDRRLSTGRIVQVTAIGFIAGLIFLAFSAWLDAGSFHALAGDDIRGFTYAREGYTAYSDYIISVLRYRPFQALVGSLSASVSSGEFDSLRLIAIGFLTVNSLLLLILLVRQFRVPLPLAFALVMVAVFNRFTFYLMMVETGIIESAAITFYLLFLWATVRLVGRPSWATAGTMVIPFILVVHLHERYLVLVAVSLLVSLMIYRANRPVGLFAATASLVTVLFNVLIKKLVLQMPVLTGTTTQAIDFGVKSKALFFLDGMLNLAGVNRGPSYLSLYDYLESPLWLKVLSVASAALALLLLVVAFLARFRHPTATGRVLRFLSRFSPTTIVLCALIVVLVLSASVTFRQEYRWLYPAYVTFLILLADRARFLTDLYKSPAPYATLCGILLCAIPREVAIRAHRENFYQYSTCQTAQALYEVVTQSPEIRTAKVITIGGDEVPEHSWVFMDGMFSGYYGLPPLQFRDSASLAGAVLRQPALLQYNRSRQIFYESPRGNSGELLPEFNCDLLARASVVGTVDQNISSPNGTRFFPFAFGAHHGQAVVAPVEMQIRHDPAKRLYVSFSHVWAKAGPDLLEIFAIDSTSSIEHKILSVAVPPLQVNAVPEWQDYQITLPPNSGVLRVSVTPKTGDQSGTWLTFRQFLVQ